MQYPNEVVKLGSKNTNAVKAVKEKLNQLGYGPLDEDNINFGENTESVVKKFQEDNQLLDDGIVGKLTWERLFSGRVETKPSSDNLSLRALEIANTQLFVREKTGKNDGREVEQYLASVGLPKGYPWCQAFVYWCFDKAAKELGVVNPVPKTAGVLECLRRAKEAGLTIIYSDPQPGDQGIMDFGKGLGHTFIVEEVKGSSVFNIEGNTNGENSREGNGVYERSRKQSSIKAYIRYS